MSGFASAIGRGLAAARPTTNLIVGQLYYSTDTSVLERYNGSTWDSYSASGGITQLTSDVTAGPGSGSQAATIANNAVSNAKLRDSTAVSVIGRSANSSGDPADIAAANNGLFLGRVGDTVGFINVPSVGKVAAWNPPVAADFAWINQGTTSLVTNAGVNNVLVAASIGAGVNLALRKKTAPSVPYVITAFFTPSPYNKQFHGYGLHFRQASDGKLHAFHVLCNGQTETPYLISAKYTNATTFSADYQITYVGQFPRWLRIADDNTNRICSISGDGENWSVVHSIGRTDFLTADEVGFHISVENNAAPNLAPIVTLWNWTQS